METGGFYTWSPEYAAKYFPEPNQSGSHHKVIFKININIIFKSALIFSYITQYKYQEDAAL
jgi:hypothetical protein